LRELHITARGYLFKASAELQHSDQIRIRYLEKVLADFGSQFRQCDHKHAQIFFETEAHIQSARVGLEQAKISSEVRLTPGVAGLLQQFGKCYGVRTDHETCDVSQ
jgi:hypothetical protein